MIKLLGYVVLTSLTCGLANQPFLNCATAKPQQTSTQEQTQERLSNEKLNALHMLNQVAEQVNSLEKPQSRARLQAEIASLLWPYYRARARELFRQAFDAAGDVPMGSLKSDTDRAQAVQQRITAQREVLRLVARHDPAMAEELAAKAQPDKDQPIDTERQLRRKMSAELLVGIALDVVDTAPEQAAAIGERSLAQGEIASSFRQLLVALRRRNVGLSSRLFRVALTVLRAQSEPDGLAFMQLYFYAFQPDGTVVSSVPMADAAALLNTLLDAVTRIATSLRELRLRGKSLPLLAPQVVRLYQIAAQNYRAAVEKNYADKLPFLQQALGEIAISLTAEQRRAVETVSKIARSDTGGGLNAKIREAEAESNPQVRDVRLRAVALELLSQSGSAQATEARRLARQIGDLTLRAKTLDEISMWSAIGALRRNEYDVAHHEAKEISNLALRGRVTAEIARRALADKGYGDTFATFLLEDALLLSQKADATPDKAWALLVLAEVFTGFDVQRSFQVLGQAIDAINRANWTESPPLAPGKGGVTVNVKIGDESGAIFSSMDRPSLESLQFGPVFERLAREDYWQAVLLANRAQNAEVKARMLLAVARSVLSASEANPSR